jgi:AcrR family transcriptional regulator
MSVDPVYSAYGTAGPPTGTLTGVAEMRWDGLVTDVSDATLTDDLVAERVIRGAIEAFRSHPFQDVTAAVVADAAGLSEEAITRAFPTWDALLLVTYDRWAELRAKVRRASPTVTIEYIRLTLEEDVADPGLIRVLAGAINIAGANTPFAELFRKRYEEYYTLLVMGLQRDAALGSETIAVPFEAAATQLLALYEGLQIQMLVRPHVDVVAAFDAAVATLRDGWARRPATTWDLSD